jgi:hypothetical protein
LELAPVKNINFLEIEKLNYISVEEKIRTFALKYINEQGQFSVKIGDNDYTIISEWYDSSNIYKKFYANTTENGFMLYTINDNHITFTIELGEDENGSYMYVNYYLKYSVSLNIHINDTDFIKFISSIGNYFNIRTVVIYSNYISCDLTKKDEYYGGSYCKDIYEYLKNNKKRFQTFDSTEIKPKFNYFLLDKLKLINPMEILDKNDTDEIRTIYKNIYKLQVDSKLNNLKDFYIWMIDHYCHLITILVKKMFRIYKQQNPFENDYYILDPNIYLYNRNIISFYNFDDKDTPTNIKKNNYRINPMSRIRIPTNRKI